MRKLIIGAALAIAAAFSAPVVAQITSTVPFTCVSASNAAPAIGAVQADTGALAAGDYEVYAYLMASDTVAVGKGLVVEHRNAANAATLFQLGAVAPSAGGPAVHIPRYTIAASERIRVIAGSAAGAASSLYVSTICYRRYR